MYTENADFFGMITNIDDNFARLRDFLKAEGLEENTILIFTTDNGSAGGTKYHTAGLKGGKGSHYDGGHRVPFFMRWPNGNLTGGRDVDQLTAHLDILPTFIDLLDLKAPAIAFDGTSLKPILYNGKNQLRNRTLILENQRVVTPEKWRKCSVMTDRWRLIDGKDLYDIRADRKQGKNVAGEYPEVVEQLRADYETFWADVSREHDIFSRMIIGSEHQNPTLVTGQDVIGTPNWNHTLVTWRHGSGKGYWALNAERAGTYEISIRRWPAEFDLGINETYLDNVSMGSKTAYLTIGDETLELPVAPDAKEVTFTLELPAGDVDISTGFIDNKEKKVCANYVYILNADIASGSTNGWQTRQGLGLPLAESSVDFPPSKGNKH